MSTSLTRYAFATLRTPKAHTSLLGTPTQAERARVKGNQSFYSCSCFFFCRYIHFREICSRKMNSICFHYAANPQSSFFASGNPSRLSSIYCRSAPIRYEINPSFAKQTYRVRQHISSLYISPLARYANHIENPAGDLYRCVVSLRGTTLNLCPFRLVA